MKLVFVPPHRDTCRRNPLTGDCYTCGAPLGAHALHCSHCPPIVQTGIEQHWAEQDREPFTVTDEDRNFLLGIGARWEGDLR